MKVKHLHIYIIGLLFFGLQFSSSAQRIQTEFGQNRVQFHDFYWSLYESENFITYYYPGGKQLGRFTVKVAEDILNEIEEYYDYRINKKINILVYNDLTDYKQTNIGMEREVYNVGGNTQILENKMFIYFDGDHQNLYNSIKEGIATVVLDAMMFGGNFVEILQNAVLLNLPDWYKSGLAAYTARPWTVEQENELRKYFTFAKKPSFEDLAISNPKLAGHSFWYFLSNQYGKETIPEILYLTRVNRNVSSGLLFTIDQDLTQVLSSWFNYFNQAYAEDLQRTPADSLGEAIKLKIRNNSKPNMVRISPDGKKIAYAAQDDGRFKVFVLDTETNKAKKILKAGYKSNENFPSDTYPLISWSPSGNQLIVFYEKQDKIRYLSYNPENGDKEKVDLQNFQRIYSAEFIGAKTLVLSAQQQGFTNIFSIYLPTKRIKPLTQDYHDDLYAAPFTLDGDDGIIFSSNRHTDTLKKERLDTILPVGNMDLFFYNLATKDPALIRLTNTPFSDERYGQQIADDKYAYLSEDNGIVNIMEGYVDSVYLGKIELNYINGSIYDKSLLADSVQPDSIKLIDNYKFVGVNQPMTDFIYNVGEWDYAKKKRKVLVLSDTPKKKRAKTYVQLIPLKKLEATAKKGITPYRRKWEIDNKALVNSIEAANASNQAFVEEKGIDTIYEGNFDYTFQNKFNSVLKPKPKPKSTTSTVMSGDKLLKTVSSDVKFISSKAIPYRAKFTSDFVVTQLDNAINITNYERFGNNATFNFGDGSGELNLAGFINYGITDIMEDHRLTLGFRIPVNFDGTEIYTSYNNVKKRLDWRLLFYRKTDVQRFSYPEGTSIAGISLPRYSPLPRNLDFPDIPPGTFVNPFILGLEGRLKTHYAEASVSFPFDVVRSLRLNTAYRNEKIVFLSTDTIGLAVPTYKEHWTMLKLEYVHDNSKQLAENIPSGLKFKVWTEFHRNWSVKENIFVTGFDIRHYQKIWKTIIWANRLVYATSFGPQKVFYYLGGVDGQLNNSFDNRTPVDFSQNYGFQTGAYNLRGFRQNVRNGNSFAIWNSELRIPIFSILAKRPLKIPFLRDFQIVGFFDAGLAYKGIVPWDDDNAFDVSTFGQEPVEVEVNYYRRPTVFGMGAGLRTTILGYFLGVDVGWGRDGSEDKNSAVWHIKLSKDF